MGVYIAFAEKKFKSSSAYRFNNFAGILFSLINIFIYLSISKMMYGGNTEYDGITIAMVSTNLVITLVVGNCFHFDEFFIQTKMMDGSIGNEFLRPVNFGLRILAENVGEAAYKLIYEGVPSLLISAILFHYQLPKSFLSFVLFLISITLGYLVLWSISFLTQILGFYIINVWSVVTIKNVVINILAGVYIPIWFFPNYLKKFVEYTPFSSIYYIPVQIYLGTIDSTQILFAFLKQVIWLVSLLALCSLLFHKGKKKMIVQGG